MNLLGWMAKAKDNELKKKDREAQDEAIRAEWLDAWHEFWQRVLDTTTARRASIDEFDTDDIKLMTTIIKEKRLTGLPRDIIGWRGLHIVHIWASEDNENPLFYIAMSGWPLPHSYHTLKIGYYNDGVEVLKSRYDLVDVILRRGHEKVMAYEAEEMERRKQMLDSIQDIVNDAP